MDHTTLESYVRHAERHGTEEVFETALDESLNLRDLGFLALRLQNLDPSWKLTVDNQRLFVLALVERGKSAPEAARIAGVRPGTARIWVDDAPEDTEVGPEVALRRASKQRFEHLRGIVRGWHRTS